MGSGGGRKRVTSLLWPVSPAWGPLCLVYSRMPRRHRPLLPTTLFQRGAEGLAALALANALKERAQQALRLGVQVQAVDDGGVALCPAVDFQGQLGHGAGRQLGAALKAGTFHAGDLKSIIALGQEHELLLLVGEFVVPA